MRVNKGNGDRLGSDPKTGVKNAKAGHCFDTLAWRLGRRMDKAL